MYMATGEFFGEWSPLTCPDARTRSLEGQVYVLETVAKELKQGKVAGAYSYPPFQSPPISRSASFDSPPASFASKSSQAALSKLIDRLPFVPYRHRRPRVIFRFIVRSTWSAVTAATESGASAT